MDGELLVDDSLGELLVVPASDDVEVVVDSVLVEVDDVELPPRLSFL